MAKIKPISLVESISGRICSQDGTYFATNSSSGAVKAVKLCNPYQGEATEKQKTVRQTFTLKSQAANEWLNTNKPTDTNKEGTALYQRVQAMKKQFKLSNIRQVLYKYMDKDGVITLPAVAGEGE